MRGNFENTLKLTRFALRREGLIALIWTVILVGFAWGYPALIVSEYTSYELASMREVMANPAMVALLGMTQGGAQFTAGAMYATELGLFKIIAIAIMNIFLVVRHTREDEESGRYEVLRSLPVGRLSGILAALLTALVVNFAIAVGHGLALGSLGIEGMGFAGSFTFGAMLGVSGLMFAAVTALCAQLSASARSVKGYAFLVLLVFYLLRAVGDVNNETVAMVSPLGLILRALPFYENNLIPIFLVLFFAVILTAMAFRLCARRDIGQGIIPARAGRPFAKKYMTTLFGHTWRISRGTLISWAIGMFVFGAVFGLVIGDVEVFTAEAEWFAAMMPPNADFTLTEMFTALLNTFLVLFAAVPALILVLKLRAEEKAGRTEMLISTAVTRQSHMAGFVALAVIAALIMPFLGMISMWLFSIPVLDEPMNLRGLAQAVMSFVPAIGVTVGLVAAVAGWLPRLVSFVWGYYGFVFVSGFFGTMLSLPEWLMSLSPFHHIPQMPMDSWQTAPVVILSITAIALTIFGIWGYSRRDIA